MNMKKEYIAIFLILTIFLISACTAENKIESNTNNVEKPTTPIETQTNAPIEQKSTTTEQTTKSESITLDKIYNYAKISTFEYKITTTAAQTPVVTNMKYTLSSDNINGKAAWLSTADVSTQGVKVLSKIWTDKTTFECLKVSSVVNYNGKDIETVQECPKSGPDAASKGEIPQLTYIGTETVTVPLGTFNAKKYLLNNTITYYYSDSVPIPIKVTYESSNQGISVTSIMELTSWN